MTLRIGWFTTARGSGSRSMYEAVADAIATGSLDAKITVVFCNRDPADDPQTDQFFARVRADGIPLVTRSSVKYRRRVGGERSRTGEALPEWRAAYDLDVASALASHPFDVGVLAGYMLIFGPQFVQQHVLLNLHPALPGGPTGTWHEVIRGLIRTRAAESGVMLHLAAPEVDTGAVVAYCRYSLHATEIEPAWVTTEEQLDSLDDKALEETPLFAAIRAAGVVREPPLVTAALGAFATGALHVLGGRIVNRAGQTAPPADLTAEVDSLIAGRAAV